MLIIGLIGAAALYAILYLLYLAADARLSSSSSALSVINEMLFVPEGTVFFLLRCLILITFFYVVADALLNPARRQLRNRKHRRKDAEYDKKVFRGIKRPKPQEDDDGDPNSPLYPHY